MPNDRRSAPVAVSQTRTVWPPFPVTTDRLSGMNATAVRGGPLRSSRRSAFPADTSQSHTSPAESSSTMRRPSDETHAGTVSAVVRPAREVRSNRRNSFHATRSQTRHPKMTRVAAWRRVNRIAVFPSARTLADTTRSAVSSRPPRWCSSLPVSISHSRAYPKPTDRSDFPSPTNASDRTPPWRKLGEPSRDTAPSGNGSAGGFGCTFGLGGAFCGCAGRRAMTPAPIISTAKVRAIPIPRRRLAESVRPPDRPARPPRAGPFR